VEALGDLQGQHALDLGQRALRGRRRRREPEAPRRQQTQDHGQRLFLCEEQGRQLEAGAQSIGTVAAVRGFDRDAQVLKHRDITAHRAAVDLQAPGQLGATHGRSRLQQLQDGQQACRRLVHTSKIAPK
jgi:hypothetical protein